MAHNEDQPGMLYGGQSQDMRVYQELVKLNKSAKVIRQWVTVVGILATLILLFGIMSIVVPMLSSTPY
jgi:hypothetical protein